MQTALPAGWVALAGVPLPVRLGGSALLYTKAVCAVTWLTWPRCYQHPFFHLVSPEEGTPQRWKPALGVGVFVCLLKQHLVVYRDVPLNC